jgi:TRAP-type C4-dicarboxylate transport system substrate-binding protein
MSEYDALPEETRRQVMLAAADTESYTADLLSHRTAENYEKMREHGVTIRDPAPNLLAAILRESAKEPIAAWKQKVPSEMASLVDRISAPH